MLSTPIVIAHFVVAPNVHDVTAMQQVVGQRSSGISSSPKIPMRDSERVRGPSDTSVAPVTP